MLSIVFIIWSWYQEIEKDDWALRSVMVVEWCTRKREGGWRLEWYGGNERILEIRGMTCLIGISRSHITAITHCIGSCTCSNRNGKLMCTQNSLKSQYHMIIGPISVHLISSTQPSPMIISYDPPYYHSMPLSWVNHEYSICQVLHTAIPAHTDYYVHQDPSTPSNTYTEYCTHWVLHTPSTAYAEYCIHQVLHTLSSGHTEYCIPRVLHTPTTAYTKYCIHRVLRTLNTTYTD